MTLSLTILLRYTQEKAHVFFCLIMITTLLIEENCADKKKQSLLSFFLPCKAQNLWAALLTFYGKKEGQSNSNKRWPSKKKKHFPTGHLFVLRQKKSVFLSARHILTAHLYLDKERGRKKKNKACFAFLGQWKRKEEDNLSIAICVNNRNCKLL